MSIVNTLGVGFANMNNSKDGVTASQQSLIDKARADGVPPEQIAMQIMNLKMQNMSDMAQAFSNLLKKLGEINQSIVANMR